MPDLVAYHTQAMRLYERAQADAKAGRLGLARVQGRLALYLEGGVAVVLARQGMAEPTRSAICRSAVVMAVAVGEWRQADRFTALCLAGAPPPEEVVTLLRLVQERPILLPR